MWLKIRLLYRVSGLTLEGAQNRFLNVESSRQYLGCLSAVKLFVVCLMYHLKTPPFGIIWGLNNLFLTLICFF